ncbi:MAG: hypothetical protein ACTHL8_27185 [Burkholderiaceae bacterium]
MHKITNASALANLTRLGVDRPRDAWSALRRWRRMHNATKRVLQARHVRDVRWSAEPGLPSSPQGRLFMSFHYGLWYMTLAALAEATGCRKVYCLVGQTHPSYTDRMAAMARSAGIEIVVVPGGLAMLRGVRQARAEGALIFVLIDVPWGVSDEPDLRLPFLGGHIEAKSALFTFAARAGLAPHLVVADADDEGATFVRHHAIADQAEAFRLLERYVGAKPWLWERLVDLHQYVDIPRDPVHLPFRIGANHFLANMSDLRVARVNPALYDRVLQARKLAANGYREQARNILDDLHARTSLDIRAVF